ncbi:MAG: UPF0182 family protein [Armatimonadetes bacterium]|nr:UPF0182 family protein [Armatimonadota bacterium]
MSRAVFTLFRTIEWLWRRRIFRALIWFFAALWLLDGAIYGWTESQWFASLGMENLWGARVGAQIALFGAFFGICLLLARGFLGAVTRISSHSAPPLRGSLSRFEPLRDRATRWAWGLTLLWALFLARDFARRHWSDYLFARGGADSDFTAFGLPAALWTHFLPLFAPFLGALWDFSLGLSLVVAASGILRALPLLAAREPLPPPVLPRTLWRLGAWLLFLRALGYITQIFALDEGRPLESGDLFVSFPLWALGALGCLLFASHLMRRASTNKAPHHTARWALGMGAALFAPAMANLLLAPARALMPETAWLRAQREKATRAAWNLNFPPSNSPRAATPIEQAWPVWDEKTLLQTRRGARFQKGQLVEWKSATLGQQKGGWSALLAGQKVGATSWTARRDADESTALALQRLQWPQNEVEVSGAPLAGSDAFFGLEGRSLFSDEPIGVPIRSWGAKWAWAWRLRDLFLPFDGANFSHLLVFRGAEERAQRLAPFWKLGGAPRLVLNGENPYWMVPLCAVSSHFPGAMSAPSGDLAGVNAASNSVAMLLEARTGAVKFFAARSNRSDFLLDSWRRALPQTLHDAAQMPAPLHAQINGAPELLRAQIELESALSGAGEEVQITPAQHSFDAARGEVLRVAAIGNDGWRVLEAARGEKILRRGEGDFAARLRAIDAQINTIPRPTTPVESGEPFLWPDESAPGGWWIARAFFTAPQSASGAKLWRVALTGTGVDARVSVAASVSAVRRGFAVQEEPQSSPTAPAPLETQALQAHEAAQSAGRKGDWTAFGRESARLKTILETLAARRANPPAKSAN